MEKGPQHRFLSHIAQDKAKSWGLALSAPWMGVKVGAMAHDGPTWATEGPMLGLS